MPKTWIKIFSRNDDNLVQGTRKGLPQEHIPDILSLECLIHASILEKKFGMMCQQIILF